MLLLGPYIIRVLIRLLSKLDVLEAKLFISFVFVMMLAWLANLAGLATIVGAFAAGLLLDTQFSQWGDHRRHKYSIKELFAPLEAILVPIFFVLMVIITALATPPLLKAVMKRHEGPTQNGTGKASLSKLCE